MPVDEKEIEDEIQARLEGLRLKLEEASGGCPVNLTLIVENTMSEDILTVSHQPNADLLKLFGKLRALYRQRVLLDRSGPTRH